MTDRISTLLPKADSAKIFARLAPFALVAGFGLAGCNTVEGIGEDVEEGGETLEEAADETEEEL